MDKRSDESAGRVKLVETSTGSEGDGLQDGSETKRAAGGRYSSICWDLAVGTGQIERFGDKVRNTRLRQFGCMGGSCQAGAKEEDH